MSTRDVLIYGNPVLRTKALEITEIDDTVRHLVEDMFATMKANNGVGLAANQIGVLHRVIVVDVPIDDTRRTLALVNPKIDRRSGSEKSEEGCLSIPGIFADVKRSHAIRVRALDESGQPFEVEAEGYLARAIQHEVDHLDGVLFVDRLSPLKRQFLRRSLDALARGELPEDYRPPAFGGSR